MVVKVLHVLGRLDRGGAETMVMNFYRNIDHSKVRFDFIIHTDEKCDYTDEIIEFGGKIHSVPRYNGKNHFQYKKAWNDFFKENSNYTIIHGHVRSTASIYLRIAKKHGLTTIAHSHSTSSGKGISAFVKDTLQFPIRFIADQLFACSVPAGVWLYGKDAPDRDNFYVIRNAIESQKFSYDESVRKSMRRKLNLIDKFVIGHVGRLEHPKNHKFLIDIFKKVVDQNENAVLVLVGQGKLEKELKEKVDNLELTNNVIFTGVRKDISEILQAMDVFVLPSLFEGLGIVAIEAQAAGLKCVVSDVVPREAFVTDLIKSVPLEHSAKEWASAIIEEASYQRGNKQKDIEKAGYDIEENSKWLENFYLNISK